MRLLLSTDTDASNMLRSKKKKKKKERKSSCFKILISKKNYIDQLPIQIETITSALYCGIAEGKYGDFFLDGKYGGISRLWLH